MILHSLRVTKILHYRLRKHVYNLRCFSVNPKTVLDNNCVLNLMDIFFKMRKHSFKWHHKIMKSIYKIDSNLVGFSFKYNELVSFYIYTELKYNFVCYIMFICTSNKGISYLFWNHRKRFNAKWKVELINLVQTYRDQKKSFKLIFLKILTVYEN